MSHVEMVDNDDDARDAKLNVDIDIDRNEAKSDADDILYADDQDKKMT